MLLYGVLNAVTGNGMFVRIDTLRAEYGPLPFVGKPEDYQPGAKVLVGHVGTYGDEYIVMGRVLP